MTADTMNLRGLLEKTADTDFLREMIGFTGSCPLTWCKSVVGHYALRRGWPVCQSATAGKLTLALSLQGALVSSVM